MLQTYIYIYVFIYIIYIIYIYIYIYSIAWRRKFVTQEKSIYNSLFGNARTATTIKDLIQVFQKILLMIIRYTQ